MPLRLPSTLATFILMLLMDSSLMLSLDSRALPLFVYVEIPPLDALSLMAMSISFLLKMVRIRFFFSYLLFLVSFLIIPYILFRLIFVFFFLFLSCLEILNDDRLIKDYMSWIRWDSDEFIVII